MEEKKTLGELIEMKVHQKGISIIDFAKRINCVRGNAYHLFKRGDGINVLQLKKISEVLGHNFFQDLANDMDLAREPSMSAEDLQNEKAVSQFFNVVPELLSELGRDPSIMFCNLDKDPNFRDCPIAKYALPNYLITFTVGDTLKDRMGDKLPIEVLKNSGGLEVELLTARDGQHVLKSINIKLDYKTKEEWSRILKFAFDVYERNNKTKQGYGYTYVYVDK